MNDVPMNDVAGKGRLEGKRCLVTGGSRGLGRAIALAFAREGGKIAFTYKSDLGAAETALAALRAIDPGGLAFRGDVADSKHVKDVVGAVEGAWGRVDVLVNAAALNAVVPLALLDEDEWDLVLATNLKGPYLFSRAVLRGMIRRKKGHVLNVGAFTSERLVEAPVHFAASKAGLRGFTEALALEVGKYGILVNLLAPGLLDTGLGASLLPHRQKEYAAMTALRRLERAEDVAKMAVFLVSDENTFMTGAKIALDGGL